jgi:hypothetical protein
VEPRSLAWRAYHAHLREIAQLLRADPASAYGKSGASLVLSAHELLLSAALCRGALVLTCSHLQGFFMSITQEYLEQIDKSSLDVASLPHGLKLELCLKFPYPASVHDQRDRAQLLHERYWVLWQDGKALPGGTLRTDSLLDPSANPWPDSLIRLFRHTGVEVPEVLRAKGGNAWIAGVGRNVKELVQSRNKLAHGDESVSVTADDVRRLMQWSTRFARATDDGLGVKLRELIGTGWVEADE